MRVMALFSTSFFAKCLLVGEDGPGPVLNTIGFPAISFERISVLD